MSRKPKDENYLERIPVRPEGLEWSVNTEGIVTLEVENKGAMNRIAQKLLKKPKISYIHLDEIGSFVWPLMDGERDITEIGAQMDAHFGEKIHPTYERLAQFFKILESYGFVQWKTR